MKKNTSDRSVGLKCFFSFT